MDIQWQAKFARARRFRLAAAVLAGVAAILLAVAILFFERAVTYEGRFIGDVPTYPAAAAILLFVVAAALALRSATYPGDRGVAASTVAVIFAGVGAVLAAFGMVIEASTAELVVCLARRDVWLASFTRATPDPCGGYDIPKSELYLFNDPANIALAAGGVGVVTLLLLFLGRKRQMPSAHAKQP